ncbi:MAG: hypothetical protein BAJALOKI1v1_160027 [Promethearchaeota archaeon]|nr:MAG: hypothetical protein BAJALOKI1v1_160027 [Candidatus Lokiarchaeota archaeon]
MREKQILYVIIVLLILLIFSHFYREVEFFTAVGDKFYGNIPLFTFNTIKLFLSMFCVILVCYLSIIE